MNRRSFLKSLVYSVPTVFIPKVITPYWGTNREITKYDGDRFVGVDLAKGMDVTGVTYYQRLKNGYRQLDSNGTVLMEVTSKDPGSWPADKPADTVEYVKVGPGDKDWIPKELAFTQPGYSEGDGSLIGVEDIAWGDKHVVARQKDLKFKYDIDEKDINIFEETHGVILNRELQDMRDDIIRNLGIPKEFVE